MLSSYHNDGIQHGSLCHPFTFVSFHICFCKVWLPDQNSFHLSNHSLHASSESKPFSAVVRALTCPKINLVFPKEKPPAWLRDRWRETVSTHLCASLQSFGRNQINKWSSFWPVERNPNELRQSRFQQTNGDLKDKTDRTPQTSANLFVTLYRNPTKLCPLDGLPSTCPDRTALGGMSSKGIRSQEREEIELP